MFDKKEKIYTDNEIEEKMEKALKKIPFEMKKIQIVLFLLKKIGKVKKNNFSFMKWIIYIYVMISAFLLLKR